VDVHVREAAKGDGVRRLSHDRETIRAYLAAQHIGGQRRPGPTRTGWSIVATMATMALPTVIVLNGASSVGKSTLAVALQDLLPRPFLHVGVDTLLAAMPPSSAGIAVADDGSVAVAGDFRRLELAWYAGLAAMASSGAGLIIDEVFLTGQTVPATTCQRARKRPDHVDRRALPARRLSQPGGQPT